MSQQSDLLIVAQELGLTITPVPITAPGVTIKIQKFVWTVESIKCMRKFMIAHRSVEKIQRFLRVSRDQLHEIPVRRSVVVSSAVDAATYDPLVKLIVSKCINWDSDTDKFSDLLKTGTFVLTATQRLDCTKHLLRINLARRINSSSLRIIAGFPSWNRLCVPRLIRSQLEKGRLYRQRLFDFKAYYLSQLVAKMIRNGEPVLLQMGEELVDLTILPCDLLVLIFRYAISKF